MKKLYFIHFGARIEPGVAKKINAQIEQFKKCTDTEEINVTEIIQNPDALRKVKTNMLLLYSNKYAYSDALSHVDDNSIVYIRRNKADKYYIDFLRKLKDKRCTILVELPTYPYFKDDFSNMKYWPAFMKELWSIPKFNKYVDRFVTYSNDKEIFGIPTIKVKNGVYVDQIEPRKRVEAKETINLLAVATFRKHHGYERIIKGLANYYANGGDRTIILRMVGEGDEKQKYVELVIKNNLQDNVKFLGKMVGIDLSKQYGIADIALGSFGMYKIGVFTSSVLKVREYLAKGLPIVSGCHEDAFEGESFDYFLEFPNDNSVVDIKKIVDFYDQIYLSKSEDEKDQMVLDIREYAKKQVDYDVVFQNVIDYLKGVI